MMQRVAGTSLITVVLIGLFWGLNWPAVKFMLGEMPPVTIRAVGFTIAAMCLVGYAKFRKQPLAPARQDRLPIAITGLLLIFGFNVLTALGQALTETSKAAIIAYTMPAMTAGLAAVLLGERLDRRRLTALIVGITGLAVLASEDLALLVENPAGPLIMLSAAFSWALGNIALKSRSWSLPAIPLTAWFFIASGALCWLIVLLFEPPWQQNWPSPPVFWTLIYHALGPMVVCYVLWAELIHKLPASIAGITTLLAPVVGVLSAMALLGDVMTWQKALALAMILGSIYLAIAPARTATAGANTERT